MAAVSAQEIRGKAREAIFASGGRGFVRFLPSGGALLVSDALRRAENGDALQDSCRAAGFETEESGGLLLLTPTEETLRALYRPCGLQVNWEEETAFAAAFAQRLLRKKDVPLTAEGKQLVLETLRLLSQDDAHILRGMDTLRALAALQLRRKDESGLFASGALIAEWYHEKGGLSA